MKKFHAAVFAAILAISAVCLTGCTSASGKFNDATSIPLKWTPGEYKVGKVVRVMMTPQERHKYITDYDSYCPEKDKDKPIARIVLHNFAFLIYTTTTAVIP